jgi:hypothetical protein
LAEDAAFVGALPVPDPSEVLAPDPESVVPEPVEAELVDPDPASPGMGVAEPAEAGSEAAVCAGLAAAEDVCSGDPAMPGVAAAVGVGGPGGAASGAPDGCALLPASAAAASSAPEAARPATGRALTD